MIPYRFLTPAEEEMTEAALFYEAASSQLGIDFLDDVQKAVDRLRAFPHAGEAVTSGVKQTLLHRFPFSLIYTIEENVIVVIAVAHHGRPGRGIGSRVSIEINSAQQVTKVRVAAVVSRLLLSQPWCA
jgi:toxin ParE1/3/4